MDLETRERVLKLLLDCYRESKQEIYGNFPELCKDIHDVEPHILEATVKILKSEALIDYFWAENMPQYIRLTPDGLAYFDRKKQAKKEKWAERRWSLIEMVSSFAAGVLVGFLVDLVRIYWLK